MTSADMEARLESVLSILGELPGDIDAVQLLAREEGRRQGAEKALFYAACALEQLPVRDPHPGETPAEYMGAYKALIEAQIHVLDKQIAEGRLNLRPLPIGSGAR